MPRWREAALICLVVNARHVKNVPGRKTDVCDAEWLATLARAGLLKPSFIPPEKLRRLRLVSRQRQKLAGMLAAEKNRLGKVLADAGVRLGVVVSDINGKSARAMIAALIGGATPEASGQARRAAGSRRHAGDRRRARRRDQRRARLRAAIDRQAHRHAGAEHAPSIDAYLIAGLDQPEERTRSRCLQTIPGIDDGAAMLLVEIGTDMALFAGARPPGLVGRHLPGQQQERGQTQARAHAQGQHLRAPPAVRVRPRRAQDPVGVPGQVQGRR